ncbi:reverse transcriptase family protein [Chloroflexota bacterium]
MNYLPPYLSLQYTEDLLVTLQEEFGLDTTELSKATELLDSKLPPLVRPEILAFLFGISYRFIKTMSMNSHDYYRTYKIAKRAGGYRRIEAPRRFLKVIQKWIYLNILSTRQLPPAITGFVRGRNIFSNAEPHKPNKNLMVIDIKDFFPSVTYQEVYQVFKNFGFQRKVLTLLTGLCTLDNRLPQGAPTSPFIANLAFNPVDLALQDLAKGWDCTYTRYADDIAFSGNTTFSRKDIKAVSQILGQSGFNINTRKTRIIGSGGRQILTGLVVNASGLPPRYKRRRWRAMFHQASLEPVKYVGQAQSLKGIASFINEYNSELASNYIHIADQISELE